MLVGIGIAVATVAFAPWTAEAAGGVGLVDVLGSTTNCTAITSQSDQQCV
ncbi:hypothetical protein SV7mr_09890 [Stieleria bergensis]|uniref:Uncharacterized protein n=1 Tax=Stieleria bergensis TaxID=2528025 RepID=A0A517SQU4_9BACT|nr:hypothetical protein SV7mr_09890 [Planctomycetes bacterium SV_7m_r]